MKDKKSIIGIISAVAAAVIVLAAAITAIIVFRQEICDFFTSLKEKACASRSKFTPEEFEDFADI